ncbi:hypothetical protein, partial [Bacillus mycoides]|uniref:hypothetical protein n=2 Tax=Bacillus TaxID=1386 RepID=UPI001A99F7D9
LISVKRWLECREINGRATDVWLLFFFFKEGEDNESIIENADHMGIQLLDVLNNAVGILEDKKGGI